MALIIRSLRLLHDELHRDRRLSAKYVAKHSDKRVQSLG